MVDLHLNPSVGASEVDGALDDRERGMPRRHTFTFTSSAVSVSVASAKGELVQSALASAIIILIAQPVVAATEFFFAAFGIGFWSPLLLCSSSQSTHWGWRTFALV